MPLWGPNRFWPGSGLVLRCLGPGFTVLALGPGFRPIFIHSFIYMMMMTIYEEEKTEKALTKDLRHLRSIHVRSHIHTGLTFGEFVLKPRACSDSQPQPLTTATVKLQVGWVGILAVLRLGVGLSMVIRAKKCPHAIPLLV